MLGHTTHNLCWLWLMPGRDTAGEAPLRQPQEPPAKASGAPFLLSTLRHAPASALRHRPQLGHGAGSARALSNSLLVAAEKAGKAGRQCLVRVNSGPKASPPNPLCNNSGHLARQAPPCMQATKLARAEAGKGGESVPPPLHDAPKLGAAATPAHPHPLPLRAPTLRHPIAAPSPAAAAPAAAGVALVAAAAAAGPVATAAAGPRLHRRPPPPRGLCPP
jgi:hypothetical protein